MLVNTSWSNFPYPENWSASDFQESRGRRGRETIHFLSHWCGYFQTQQPPRCVQSHTCPAYTHNVFNFTQWFFITLEVLTKIEQETNGGRVLREKKCGDNTEWPPHALGNSQGEDLSYSPHTWIFPKRKRSRNNVFKGALSFNEQKRTLHDWIRLPKAEQKNSTHVAL